MLYEMLTGRPPFTGDSPAVVLFGHIHKTPPPPSQLNPALAPFWDQILATALAKDPQQRHRDAAVMRQAIETGSAAPRLPGADGGPAPAFGPPTRLDTSALAETTSPVPSPHALGGRSAPESAIDDHVAAAPHRALSRRRLLTGLGVAGMAAALPATYYIFAREDSAILTSDNGSVLSVAFSPDGKILATSDDDVRLWDVATRAFLGPPLPNLTDSAAVAFSPDGKILATSSGYNVQFWDVATNTSIGGSLNDHTDDVLSVTFSPDGKILATGDDETVQLWDMATRNPIGRPLTSRESPTGAVSAVAFSPDGKILAIDDKETVQLWDVATRNPIGRPLTGHNGPVASVAFSPDGKILATGSRDDTVRLWDVATRNPIGRPLTDHTDSVYAVAFSPDGKILATGSHDNTVRLWDVATRNPIGRPLTDHTDSVYAVAFSP
ncbi:protein kinase family protein, partial [Streptosporangium sandarakinum]|uniref:protein kinase family protein n=1 Tax=Streptosporangium sandarakinum TaxID=1260955 RepID=UPI0037176B60